jgi:hypothetical protein
MTPRLMHRIAWALQHGRPSQDERAAIEAAAQHAPAGATALPGDAEQLLVTLERRSGRR